MRIRILAILPVALAASGLLALAVGCASDAPTTPIPTASGVPRVASGAPALAFDKREVDLGAVTRDQGGTQTFLVMNWGESMLEVGPVEIQAEQGCDVARAVETNIEIPPGEVVLLPIELGPHRELGRHHLLVKVASNDPSKPSSTLSLRFNVTEEPQAFEAGPRLMVDKEIIDIGAVPYDWPLYERFTLRNGGNEPLILTRTPKVRVDEGC